MTPLFVGADLGTSGIKAGVADADGKVLASLYWDAELASSAPGRMEQSPEFFAAQTLRIIREAVDKAGCRAGQVAAIALDGQMGGVIGVDRDFHPVTGLDMGLDTRSETYNALIHERHDGLLRSLTCGSPRNTPKIAWWQHEQPATYRRVVRFVGLAGYVAGVIGGLSADDAFIDHTMIAFFGNEDARRLEWSRELSDALGLELAKFPRIVKPWDIVGRLTAAAAHECGLREGTPIAAGAGDQPAGLLGGGFLEPGALCEVSGSSTLLFLCADSFQPDTANGTVVYIPSVLPGRYHAFTYINGGGVSLRWFRDTVLGGGKPPSYGELTQAAAAVPPGSAGLLFIPYFGGRQCPYDASFRGGWLGLTWGHRPEHLFRSMLEGLAYDQALGLAGLRRLFPGTAAAELASYGGGARNELWAQIKADVLGLPVRSLESHEFAIAGSAMIAARAVGARSDLAGAALPDRSPAPLAIPDPRRTGMYQRYVRAFERCCGSGARDLPEVFRGLAGSADRLHEE
jgi:xylulokinase